jgi:transposase
METMNTRELAQALSVSERTIQENAKRLGLTKNGVETNFTERDALSIKQAIEKSGRTDLANVRELDTIVNDLEMKQKAFEVMNWLAGQLDAERIRADVAENQNKLLMHTSKTYTASEVAKELGLRSAQVLNNWLRDKGVQYQANGTWLPRAQYSELGYFEIKQETFEDGHTEYHRKITQAGRVFILELAKR